MTLRVWADDAIERCRCPASDAWRCAVRQNLGGQITCQCPCHAVALPRRTFARFECDRAGCTAAVEGCVQDYGGDPMAVARRSGFVCTDDGEHYCGACNSGRRSAGHPTQERLL